MTGGLYLGTTRRGLGVVRWHELTCLARLLKLLGGSSGTLTVTVYTPMRFALTPSRGSEVRPKPDLAKCCSIDHRYPGYASSS